MGAMDVATERESGSSSAEKPPELHAEVGGAAACGQDGGGVGSREQPHAAAASLAKGNPSPPRRDASSPPDSERDEAGAPRKRRVKSAEGWRVGPPRDGETAGRRQAGSDGSGAARRGGVSLNTGRSPEEVDEDEEEEDPDQKSPSPLSSKPPPGERGGRGG